MASLEKPSHHVCSHPSKTNHSKLHNLLLSKFPLEGAISR
jgi:hypothetical protein